MSYTPLPDTASSIAPTPRPKRPWTILGRLSHAVREQNWFAVVLEVLIVIVGVVVGFQVTGWGQTRADQAAEQTYLGQLAVDLAETERRVLAVDSLNRAGGGALVKFIRAFAADPPPPTDSLLKWGWKTDYIDMVTPVLGTVEALLSTGDIRLVRDDSLRAAIVAYLDEMRLFTDGNRAVNLVFLQRYEGFERQFDFSRAAAVMLSPAELDSLARTNYLFADAPTSGAFPYPDPDRMLDNVELYFALRNLLDTRSDFLDINQRYLAATRSLATLVEVEQSR